MSADVFWQPTSAVDRVKPRADTLRWLKQNSRTGFSDIASCWGDGSVTDLAGFWGSALCPRIIARANPPRCSLLVDARTRWFPDVSTEHAENMLRAMIQIVVRALSQPAKRTRRVAAIALRSRSAPAGLRRLGLARGDRVAAYLPNIPSALIAMLAPPLSADRHVRPRVGEQRPFWKWRTHLEPKVFSPSTVSNGRQDIDRSAQVGADRERCVAGSDGARALPARGFRVRRQHYVETSGWPSPPTRHTTCAVYASPLGVVLVGNTVCQGNRPLPTAGSRSSPARRLRCNCDRGPDEPLLRLLPDTWMVWNVLVSGFLVAQRSY